MEGSGQLRLTSYSSLAIVATAVEMYQRGELSESVLVNEGLSSSEVAVTGVSRFEMLGWSIAALVKESG